MNQLKPAPHLATTYCSIAIFLFGFLALIIPSGYSVGAVLLLLGGIYAYTQDRHTTLNQRDLYLFLLLAAFTLEGIANILWHDLSSRHYDKVVRFILAIPVFYLIRWSKPKLHWAWLGLVSGSLAVALLAIYEIFFLGLGRSGGFNNPIQFGNLSMLMGLFCLAGLGWAASLTNQKQRHFFLIALSLGALAGLAGSFLSGSRGGWVGLPFVLLVLFKAYHRFFNRRTKLLAITVVITAGFTVLSLPQLAVKGRILEAVHDVQQYQEGNKSTSVGMRFEMWRGALELIKAKPVLGWGKDGYVEGMKQLVDKQLLHPSVIDFGHAHNEILDKTAKHGLVGLFVLLALYLVPIWYFSPYLKHHHLPIRAIAVAGTLLAVAYIDFGLTQGFLSHNSGVMMYPFWLMIWAAYLRNAIGAYQSPNTGPAATVL